eukprot:5955572-Lingulodinium_polyedra.AAC.1
MGGQTGPGPPHAAGRPRLRLPAGRPRGAPDGRRAKAAALLAAGNATPADLGARTKIVCAGKG